MNQDKQQNTKQFAEAVISASVNLGKLFFLLNAEDSRLNKFVGASTSAVNHDIIKHDDNPTNQAIECQSESRRIEL